MNRTLKFRVWHEGFKRWLTKEEWVLDMDGSLNFIESIDGSLFKCEEGYVVQQFTGLVDKNNKELYEGDLVKNDPSHMANCLREDKNPNYTSGEIMWLCAGFKVGQAGLGATWLGHFSLCGCCPCGLEIIGNILENPELITLVKT